MGKAILVLDEVEECEDCDLFYIGDFGRSCPLVDIKNDKKPSCCPLKELPAKKNTISQLNLTKEAKENHMKVETQSGFNIGWNACLDAIAEKEE